MEVGFWGKGWPAHLDDTSGEAFGLANWEPSARINLSYVLLQELSRFRIVSLCEARSA